MKRVVLASLTGAALASCGAPPGSGGETADVEATTAALIGPCNPPSYFVCSDPHKIGSCSCITPAAPAVTGTVVPNFYVTHVMYAPPGKMSSISYSSSTSVGSTTSASSSFKYQDTITADVSASVPMVASGDAKVTVGAGWGDTNTQSTDVSLTYTSGYKDPGQVDSINHDEDQIWFLVNPLINVMIQPTSSGHNNVTWEFGTQDGVNNGIEYMVYAGWLNGKMTMPATVKSDLDKWGISPTYYPSLLMADPFAWGNVPNQGMDPNRFDYLGEFPFEPPLNSTDAPTTQTKIVDQKTTNSSTSQYDTNYSVGVSVTSGASFAGVFKAEMTDSMSWTWTSSTSLKETNGTGSTDTLIIGQPAFGYTGPTLLHVWEDKVYKTYAFSLDNPVGVPMPLGPSTKETYTTGDFNGDGKMDMIVTSSTGSDWYFSTGPGTWELRARRPDLPLGWATYTTGDFDGDHKTDIIITTPNGSWWGYSRGDGSFTNFYSRTDLTTSNTHYVPGDFDGDGKTDLIIVNPSGSYWYYSTLSQGAGSFVSPHSDAGLTLGWATYTTGDFDGNGKTDFIVTTPLGSWWNFSTGRGTWVNGYTRTDLNTNNTHYTTGDFDGNGKVDLIITNPSGSYWYMSNFTNGSGSYTCPHSDAGLTLGWATYTTGDFDGNHMTDFIITTPLGSWWAYSTGPGTWNNSYTRTDLNSNNTRYTTGDFDGTGRTDLIITMPSGSYWYIAGPTAGSWTAPYTRPDLVL